MTTAPRPRPTLNAAVQSLLEAGYDSALFVVDDGVLQLGIVGAWVRALHELAKTSADVLVVIQDDVTWPADGWNLLRWSMAELLERDHRAGYGSYFTSARVHGALTLAERDGGRGFVFTGDLPVRWSGALCYALPRASAELLLTDPQFQAESRRQIKSVDVLVSAALNRLGRPTYTWHPSLVGHELGKGNRTRRQGMSRLQ